MNDIEHDDEDTERQIRITDTVMMTVILAFFAVLIIIVLAAST